MLRHSARPDVIRVGRQKHLTRAVVRPATRRLRPTATAARPRDPPRTPRGGFSEGPPTVKQVLLLVRSLFPLGRSVRGDSFEAAHPSLRALSADEPTAQGGKSLGGAIYNSAVRPAKPPHALTLSTLTSSGVSVWPFRGLFSRSGEHAARVDRLSRREHQRRVGARDAGMKPAVAGHRGSTRMRRVRGSAHVVARPKRAGQ